MIVWKLTGDCRFVVIAVWLISPVATVNALELEEFFKRPDQRAAELLENGEHEAAAIEFEDPQWRGVSRYKAGLYQEAMEDFSAAEDAKGLYNHGTSAARVGDYTQAVASLEQALQLAPDDTDIAHNLEIARQLKELAEEEPQQDQNPDQNQQEQEDQQQDSEAGENNQDDNQSDQQNESANDSQDGEQGEEGEQSENNSQPSENQSQANAPEGSKEENSGEMTADQSDQMSEQQAGGAEELRDMMQQERMEQQNDTQETPDQQQVAASASVSEDDQATEQWLRRIPDDASQLLRNKIRLNHLIEYPEVENMQEPW